MIKEITCFTITVMLLLMFLKTRKSTSSIKQVIFKQVHLFFIPDLVEFEENNFHYNGHCV